MRMCVHSTKEIYYKELSHIIKGADKTKIYRVSQQAGDPGELMVYFWFEGWQGQDPGRANVSVQL